MGPVNSKYPNPSPTEKVYSEKKIQEQFDRAYDWEQHLENTNDVANPYRVLQYWFLTDLGVVKEEFPSLENRNAVLTPGTYLCGWLQPPPRSEKAPVFCKVRLVPKHGDKESLACSFVFDRSKEFRGFWIMRHNQPSLVPIYRLLEPDMRKYDASVVLPFRGLIATASNVLAIQDAHPEAAEMTMQKLVAAFPNDINETMLRLYAKQCAKILEGAYTLSYKCTLLYSLRSIKCSVELTPQELLSYTEEAEKLAKQYPWGESLDYIASASLGNSFEMWSEDELSSSSPPLLTAARKAKNSSVPESVATDDDLVGQLQSAVEKLNEFLASRVSYMNEQDSLNVFANISVVEVKSLKVAKALLDKASIWTVNTDAAYCLILVESFRQRVDYEVPLSELVSADKIGRMLLSAPFVFNDWIEQAVAWVTFSSKEHQPTPETAVMLLCSILRFIAGGSKHFSNAKHWTKKVNKCDINLSSLLEKVWEAVYVLPRIDLFYAYELATKRIDPVAALAAEEITLGIEKEMDADRYETTLHGDAVASAEAFDSKELATEILEICDAPRGERGSLEDLADDVMGFKQLYTELGDMTTNGPCVEYKCKHKTTKMIYHVKCFERGALCIIGNDAVEMNNEIAALREAKGVAGVRQLHNEYSTVDHLYVVMEFLNPQLTVREYFKKDQSGQLSEEDVCTLVKGVSPGIRHLHKAKIAIRNLSLKTLNFRVSGDMSSAVISDLSYAAPCYRNNSLTDKCGNPEYVAPEVLEERPAYDFRCDMWSFGCIIHTLLTGVSPFREFSEDFDVAMENRIREGAFNRGICWKYISQEAQNLIEGLLVVDPKNRWDMSDVLECEWITQSD
ncbi:hypothetical protein MPSEU_000024500 [Mayamaea pseudoterrestris]|nr:hypothetical protein MPSEU_000024500 [Mayamaea pseudoterrestris]